MICVRLLRPIMWVFVQPAISWEQSPVRLFWFFWSFTACWGSHVVALVTSFCVSASSSSSSLLNFSQLKLPLTFIHPLLCSFSPSLCSIETNLSHRNQDVMDHFEILIRSILIRPDEPAVLLLGHFSPQTHQTHGFAEPDHWHNIVAQFYDVPHVSIKIGPLP